MVENSNLFKLDVFSYFLNEKPEFTSRLSVWNKFCTFIDEYTVYFQTYVFIMPLFYV